MKIIIYLCHGVASVVFDLKLWLIPLSSFVLYSNDDYDDDNNIVIININNNIINI